MKRDWNAVNHREIQIAQSWRTPTSISINWRDGGTRDGNMGTPLPPKTSSVVDAIFGEILFDLSTFTTLVTTRNLLDKEVF